MNKSFFIAASSLLIISATITTTTEIANTHINQSIAEETHRPKRRDLFKGNGSCISSTLVITKCCLPAYGDNASFTLHSDGTFRLTTTWRQIEKSPQNPCANLALGDEETLEFSWHDGLEMISNIIEETIAEDGQRRHHHSIEGEYIGKSLSAQKWSYYMYVTDQYPDGIWASIVFNQSFYNVNDLCMAEFMLFYPNSRASNEAEKSED